MPRDRRNFEWRNGSLMVCDGAHGPHQDCQWRDATPAEVLFLHRWQRAPKEKNVSLAGSQAVGTTEAATDGHA